MATFLYFSNPFAPTEQVEKFAHEGGISILDWLEMTGRARVFSDGKEVTGPDGELRTIFAEFDRPTICVVNGEQRPQAFWRFYVVQPGDTVSFSVIPGWEGVIIALVVAIVVAVATVLLMPVPEQPAGTPDADPVFTLSGQRNQARLSQPIEVVYGRCRVWPSYAARPYNVYSGNEQYQFNLFCIGQGFYEVHSILIEDTPIQNFQEATFEIIPPGAAMTLFPDNVDTSIEVSNIQLFGPNEEEYDGWTGPFVANAPGTTTNRLEVDLTFPGGLFWNHEGALLNSSATVEFEYQSVDDFGNPIGGWASLGTWTFTDNSNTPLRFTQGLEVAPGRYQVRGRRTSNRSTQSSVTNDVYFEAMRAFMPSTKVYGDVTLLAVKMRATNSLNNNSRVRVNGFVTRQLPIWDSGSQTWSDPISTRSPVWAFCDVFRNRVYGGRLPDEFLDLDGLLELDAHFTVTNKRFDWTFDQRATVWEAAKTIARVGRCVPMLFGSRVGMVRDRLKTVPVAVFGPDNTVKGSFKWDIELSGIEPVDHVVMTYTDPDTWKDATVECGLPGMSRDNPETIKFAGCTNLQHAYREGMYIMSGKRYWRETVSFRTGLEGMLPNYGDLIAVLHDVPRWGQWGAVVQITEGQASYVFPADFEDFPNGRVYFVGYYNGKPAYTSDRTANASPYTDVFIRLYWSVADSLWLFEKSQADAVQLVPMPDSADKEDAEELGLTAQVVTVIDLTRPVTFPEPWATTVIAFRTKTGGTLGPFPAYDGGHPFAVVTTSTVDETKLLFDAQAEPVGFYFGLTDRWSKLCQVVDIQPSDGEEVEIMATNYDARVFAYDNSESPTTPPVVQPPAIPDLPTVTGLVVGRPSGVNGLQKITATWKPTPGATSYVVEKSANGNKWAGRRQTTDTSIDFLVDYAATVYIRVAAVNVDIGPWTTWTGEVGYAANPPAAPVGLALASAWTGTSLQTTWQPVPDSQGYRVTVYPTGSPTPLREDESLSTSYDYTLAKSLADGNTSRALTVKVTAANSAGQSTAATLDATNAVPGAATSLASFLDTGTTYNCTWTFAVPADFLKFRVYRGLTPGFTPSSGNMVYEGTTAGCQITTGGNTNYWKVATMDVWGTEETMSSEATIIGTNTYTALIAGSHRSFITDDFTDWVTSVSGNPDSGNLVSWTSSDPAAVNRTVAAAQAVGTASAPKRWHRGQSRLGFLAADTPSTRAGLVFAAKANGNVWPRCFTFTDASILSVNFSVGEVVLEQAAGGLLKFGVPLTTTAWYVVAIAWSATSGDAKVWVNGSPVAVSSGSYNPSLRVLQATGNASFAEAALGDMIVLANPTDADMVSASNLMKTRWV